MFYKCDWYISNVCCTIFLEKYFIFYISLFTVFLYCCTVFTWLDLYFTHPTDVLLICQHLVSSSSISSSSSSSSSSSRSSRTDRWVLFQQNVCTHLYTLTLRLFVHTWIVHGINDCYQLTRTFGGFSAQCLSKLFLKEFTVLLLTTSLGRAFQVVVILIG